MAHSDGKVTVCAVANAHAVAPPGCDSYAHYTTNNKSPAYGIASMMSRQSDSGARKSPGRRVCVSL